MAMTFEIHNGAANVALERLAQATTNRGTVMASPLQALVRRPAIHDPT